MGILKDVFGNKGSQENKSTGKTCPSCGKINKLDSKFCSSCGSEFHIVLDNFDAFISYRRDTGSELASLLKIQLESRFHKTVFLDINELQVGRFDEELLRRIETTPNFIVILSRASLERCANKSDWLKREIIHAIKTNRNIIPVLTEGFAFPSDELWALLPTEMRILTSLNGVNYSHIHQDSAIRKIASCIKTQADISGKWSNPLSKEGEDPSGRNFSEPSIQNTALIEIIKEKPEKNEKTATDSEEDSPAPDMATSVRHDDIVKANQQQKILIGPPKIISKTVQTKTDSTVKLGTIVIFTLSNKTEGKFISKIGNIKINEV